MNGLGQHVATEGPTHNRELVNRDPSMQSIEQMKAAAKRLRSYFKSIDIPLSVAQSLEAVAAQHGFKDWNTAVASANNNPTWHSDAIAGGIAAADSGKLTSLDEVKAKWAIATVCVTADMTSDEVRAEVDDCLRAEPRTIRLRIDAAASGAQLREARNLAKEVEANKGVRVEVDSPL